MTCSRPGRHVKCTCARPDKSVVLWPSSRDFPGSYAVGGLDELASLLAASLTGVVNSIYRSQPARRIPQISGIVLECRLSSALYAEPSLFHAHERACFLMRQQRKQARVCVRILQYILIRFIRVMFARFTPSVVGGRCKSIRHISACFEKK